MGYFVSSVLSSCSYNKYAHKCQDNPIKVLKTEKERDVSEKGQIHFMTQSLKTKEKNVAENMTRAVILVVVRKPTKNRSKERPGSDEEELTVTPRGLVDLVTNATVFNDTILTAECFLGNRNNPSHFEEFSHPGDQDFVETKDTSSDNEENKPELWCRVLQVFKVEPECQYGVECYRKNRKHRQKYSHTKKVRPKRNAARKGCQKQQADNEDSDSYIDDSDVYEPSDSDSDWNPDEESDEDIGRLVREAKGFMKNKRL
ncbi:uncharacterized protein LOC143242010 [Tachypleus tridentatus]|uniref:uncharacterized protein LOC143242010 n=1 Tax=Tachypleus tridentatus TaxID=6853 RepID=UPI003FD665D5